MIETDIKSLESEILHLLKARILYDGTYRFCERFLKRGDRTIDQMVQAARSGKQNILEGSQASGTSKEMEIKLVNVARASLEELLEDYRDYLRTRGHPQWEKDSKEALFVRKLGSEKRTTYESYKTYLICQNYQTYTTHTTYFESKAA